MLNIHFDLKPDRMFAYEKRGEWSRTIIAVMTFINSKVAVIAMAAYTFLCATGTISYPLIIGHDVQSSKAGFYTMLGAFTTFLFWWNWCFYQALMYGHRCFKIRIGDRLVTYAAFCHLGCQESSELERSLTSIIEQQIKDYDQEGDIKVRVTELMMPLYKLDRIWSLLRDAD